MRVKRVNAVGTKVVSKITGIRYEIISYDGSVALAQELKGDELVEDGKNGYLCDSAAELTQRMEQLCETKEPPSEFKPLDGYSVRDYARKILELYKKVIHESKHKKPPRPKRQTRRRNKQFNGAS